MKKIFIFFISILFVLSTFAQGLPDGNFRYIRGTSLKATTRHTIGSHLIFSNPTSGLLYASDSIPAWIIGGGGGSGWLLTGNAGTDPSTDFIGTTDNLHPLKFRVSNVYSGMIDSTNKNAYFGTLSGSTGTYNSGFGFNCLYKITTGFYNVAIGMGAGQNITDGQESTALGFNALSDDQHGTRNTAVGAWSLDKTNGGSYNTSVGWHNYYFNLTGGFNTGIGTESGYKNRSGSINTAIGYWANYSNIFGSNNICLGAYSGMYAKGQSNILYINSIDRNDSIKDTTRSIIFGVQNTDSSKQRLRLNSNVYIGSGWKLPFVDGAAGEVLTTNGTGTVSWQPAGGGSFWTLTGNAGTNPATDFVGTTDAQPLYFRVNNHRAGFVGYGGANSDNTFLGYQAGDSVIHTAGERNTFIGYRAGMNDSTGYENTCVGMSAGAGLTSGGSNTLIGMSAGLSLTTGGDNVMIGADAGLFTTTAGGCIFIGTFAGHNNTTGTGIFIGGSSGFNNTTGTGNIFMAAGGVNTIGIDNICLYGGASNTTGSYNVFLGRGSGAGSKRAVGNVAIGINSLYSDTAIAGGYNVALGFQAGYGNITGGQNIYLGQYAGAHLKQQSDKIFINSIDRSDSSGDVNNSPIYINQNSTVSNQHIWLNGNVHIGSSYVLPLTDGSSNQILRTNGTGTVSFSTDYWQRVGTVIKPSTTSDTLELPQIKSTTFALVEVDNRGRLDSVSTINIASLPTINTPSDSSSSPYLINTTTGITTAMLSNTIIMIQGHGGAIDISVNPQIAPGTNGQQIKLIGTSDANTVKFDDSDGLQLAGGTSFTMGLGDILVLDYITIGATSLYREVSRSDN
jgi:hypothetical protein